jgi:AAA domain-containing protein
VDGSLAEVRYFNTAGPCLPDRHYMLPPEPRLPEARGYIEEGHYFVVHAPRQTGKTTTLQTLAHALSAEGEYVALHFSCEAAGPGGDDYAQAQRDILGRLRLVAMAAGLAPELMPPDPWPDTSAGLLLQAGLADWAARSPKPLVLFFDEIDSLEGVSLVRVLRQLRDGHNSRPAPFPYSVVLCGMRDVRDYKRAAGGDPDRLGSASPFNIKVDSLRLGNFTADEVAQLYGQHTADTGQPFTDQALARAYDYTQGQPWLANALASDLTRQAGVTPPAPIEAEHVEQARERLILARATHLDSLVARLNEPRVRQVIEPLIAGELAVTDSTYDDDVTYLRDLGLLATSDPVAIANPIYREVILRVLGTYVQRQVAVDRRSFVLPNGQLEFRRLLEDFVDFWRQNAEVLVKGTVYHEVAPQLVIMAYLQRIVNGGGFIDREYGLGYRRVDLLVRWPYLDGDGKRAVQREAVELKVWRTGKPDPLDEGLGQLDSYLDRLGLEHGTLVIFDRRRTNQPLPDRIAFGAAVTPSRRSVTLLRA